MLNKLTVADLSRHKIRTLQTFFTLAKRVWVDPTGLGVDRWTALEIDSYASSATQRDFLLSESVERADVEEASVEIVQLNDDHHQERDRTEQLDKQRCRRELTKSDVVQSDKHTHTTCTTAA